VQDVYTNVRVLKPKLISPPKPHCSSPGTKETNTYSHWMIGTKNSAVDLLILKNLYDTSAGGLSALTILRKITAGAAIGIDRFSI